MGSVEVRYDIEAARGRDVDEAFTMLLGFHRRGCDQIQESNQSKQKEKPSWANVGCSFRHLAAFVDRRVEMEIT